MDPDYWYLLSHFTCGLYNKDKDCDEEPLWPPVLTPEEIAAQQAEAKRKADEAEIPQASGMRFIRAFIGSGL